MFIVPALVAASSCTDKQDADLKTVTFKAGLESPSSRAAVVQDKEGKHHFYFTNNEKVSVFDDNLSECVFNIVTPNGGNYATCDLTGKGVFAGEEKSGKTDKLGFSKSYYAVYPRLSSVTKLEKDGVVTIPANTGMLVNQIARDRAFPASPNNPNLALGGIFMGKSSNGFFDFRPLTAYVKLTITQDDIIRIRFNNNNTEGPFPSGPITVDYTGDTPVIDKSETSGGEVVLCNDRNYETTIPPGTYYLVILPMDFTKSSNGTSFKILVHTKTSGKNTVAKRIDAPTQINITPGMILDIGTIQHD